MLNQQKSNWFLISALILPTLLIIILLLTFLTYNSSNFNSNKFCDSKGLCGSFPNKEYKVLRLSDVQRRCVQSCVKKDKQEKRREQFVQISEICLSLESSKKEMIFSQPLNLLVKDIIDNLLYSIAILTLLSIFSILKQYITIIYPKIIKLTPLYSSSLFIYFTYSIFTLHSYSPSYLLLNNLHLQTILLFIMLCLAASSFTLVLVNLRNLLFSSVLLQALSINFYNSIKKFKASLTAGFLCILSTILLIWVLFLGLGSKQSICVKQQSIFVKNLQNKLMVLCSALILIFIFLSNKNLQFYDSYSTAISYFNIINQDSLYQKFITLGVYSYNSFIMLLFLPAKFIVFFLRQLIGRIKNQTVFSNAVDFIYDYFSSQWGSCVGIFGMNFPGASLKYQKYHYWNQDQLYGISSSLKYISVSQNVMFNFALTNIALQQFKIIQLLSPQIFMFFIIFYSLIFSWSISLHFNSILDTVLLCVLVDFQEQLLIHSCPDQIRIALKKFISNQLIEIGKSKMINQYK